MNTDIAHFDVLPPGGRQSEVIKKSGTAVACCESFTEYCSFNYLHSVNSTEKCRTCFSLATSVCCSTISFLLPKKFTFFLTSLLLGKLEKLPII
jgi:hypothetical protein